MFHAQWLQAHKLSFQRYRLNLHHESISFHSNLHLSQCNAHAERTKEPKGASRSQPKDPSLLPSSLSGSQTSSSTDLISFSYSSLVALPLAMSSRPHFVATNRRPTPLTAMILCGIHKQPLAPRRIGTLTHQTPLCRDEQRCC